MADIKREKPEKLEYSKVVDLPSGSGFTPQSLAFVDGNKRYVICSGSSPNNVILCTSDSYSKLGKKISTGHANGGTYCSRNGLIYTTGYENGNNYSKVVATKASDLSHAFTIYLKSSATGIAYDKTTNQFYVSAGSKIYVYPYEALAKGGDSGSYISSFTKNWIDSDNRSNQDIGGHNGVVMVCRSYTGTRLQESYIDCYNASSGEYLKSYYATYGELESVAVDAKGHMHIVFAQDRKIVKTQNIFDLTCVNGILANSGEGLFVSADKLYRSDNYEYLSLDFSEDETSVNLKNSLRDTLNTWSTSGFKPILDTQYVSQVLTTSSAKDSSRLNKTKIAGEVFGPALPTALNPVEAPFIELTVGDYTFGTYSDSKAYDRYPNDIDSMSIVKTNGSMNEYTINLVHQISPSSNPNFIDELLSKNGYDKISIRYGDANSNVIFNDTNALLIGVNAGFDFVNCNINYTIRATSSAIAIASHKRTFSSVEDKPSNIIRNLLYNDANEDLLTAFPAMRDKNFVEKNNLIPSNDTVVAVEEFKNINAVSYLKNLVAMMKNVTSDIINSNYILTIENGYFNINEISPNYIYDSSLYEVDINFPDDNQVFNFNVNTNYTWPIAYEYGEGVSNYNYEITNKGDIKRFNTNSTNLLDYSSHMLSNINSNWWTQVTEFPISATLTCRGLLSPLLLLTYIKINCIYYGSDRINSGIYIVTGQTDTLNGSGFKTTLSLLRVAGTAQHLIVDGRVKT